jgi:DivIVA domain-containing protein
MSERLQEWIRRPRVTWWLLIILSLLAAGLGARQFIRYLEGSPPSAEVTRCVIAVVGFWAIFAALAIRERRDANVNKHISTVWFMLGLAFAAIVALSDSGEYYFGLGIRCIGDLLSATAGLFVLVYAATGRLRLKIDRQAKTRAPTSKVERAESHMSPTVTMADEISSKTFPLSTRGYNIDQVDAWMEKAAEVARSQASGVPWTPLAAPSFRRALKGYRCAEVDAFSGEILAATRGLPGMEPHHRTTT